eukprot:scaffold624685_cov59-Attheya_sp.AAC.1
MPHYKAAALAALIALSSGGEDHHASAFTATTNTMRSSAFVPRLASQQISRSSSQGTNRMVMFNGGGMEELKELTKYAQKNNPMIKTATKSPGLVKLASLASVPVSAVVGFVMTPSRRLAAHTVGSIVTGSLGAIGKSRLDMAASAAALPAIAQAVIDHGLDASSEASLTSAIANVKSTYNMEDGDFEAACGDIYKSYLIGMVKNNPIAKTAELKELVRLKDVLGLGNLLVGEAHAAAAKDLYRQTCLFTPEEELADEDHPDRMALDKFLFLSERTFVGNGETPEAFSYEM